MPRPDARRLTNQTPPPGTTLFLIGMRVTNPLRVRAWLSVFLAMPRMLFHLRRHTDAGMLTYRLYVGSSLMVLSYWRSPEDLRRFAADADAPHLPAWRWFNKRFADTNSVGIWHETYVIGDHETISSGMPPWGLAEAVGAEPIGRGSATAAARLARCPV
ncbi:DUF4188 domain-containing protein [Gordonia sp. LSe1-13]|uniref:DUF4188 domain-containing protein n=1 Tax=Gordonia sesuvii TaxID=3116777 RepID=A0ABU7MDN8_9ACTN|nr:DUF4188 domain-containing protein [Gordonia sp. LSe1-13]